MAVIPVGRQSDQEVEECGCNPMGRWSDWEVE